MDAWRHVKLSLTNPPIGLILPSRAAASPTAPKAMRLIERTEVTSHIEFGPLEVSCDLVVIVEDDTPDPIPNSTVKRPSADGTAS